MKKYNWLLVISVLFYLLLATAAGYGVHETRADRDKMYKVEINRIYNSLSGENPPDKLDLRCTDSCDYVQNVEFLPLLEAHQQEAGTMFHESDNHLGVEIRPLYNNGQLTGFLRFDFLESTYNIRRIRLITQICLFIMELFIIGILLYLKYRLINPFLRMSSIPVDMAKGHLKGSVKEERSRYFGQFLWGLGQLKDTLDVTKKRELELEKEKKMLLLSLSHDIKTPLNTIKLYGKALEEGLYKEPEQKNHAACQIGKKAAEIEGYVDEIMKNSREDILDIHVEMGEFYLSELMKKVLDTYGEKCSLRMLELSVERFENRLLKGDLERSIEVFENIFENAFKYGDGRKIEVTFYEEDYCQLVRVFNTGSSVTDNDFNHLFESFFRGENSEGKQGNGLGLYICREIMRKMDGEIFAEKGEDGMAFVLVFR